ncbi:MAG: twin-arginine translocase subunit TatC [Candidatus Acetothermia bacterium]
MQDKELTLSEHLEELRFRILYSLASVVSIAVLAYVARAKLLEFLMQPYLRRSLIYLHPTEAFLNYLKLAGLAGIVLSTPWIMYQAWRFVLPALMEKEVKYLRLGFLLGGILFYAGVAVALYLALPYSLDFLSNVGGQNLDIQLSVGNYISFVSLLSFAFGLVFELPLLIILMAKLGFATPASLRRNRSLAIVICFSVAAFLTPTDLFSQALMAIPLILLYEFSLLMVRLFFRESPGEG